MRILHVVGGLANSSGTTHIILNLARDQVTAGHDVSVYYVSGRTADTVPAPDSRIEVRGFPLTALWNWAWSKEMARALMRDVPSFDVVHVHSLWLHANVAVWRACGRWDVPFMVAPQGTLDTWTLGHHRWRKAAYASLLERRILNAAGAIQAVSLREVENLRSFSVRAPVEIVPNGVNVAGYADLPERREARASLGLDEKADVILFLSRLHPKKGVELLLDAHRVAVRERPRLVLLLGGSDGGTGYAEELRARLTRLNLDDSVRMPGELRGAAKLAALSAADLFALPSHSEGLPVAALEALAAGCPVLLSPGCYLPEAESAGAGRVVSRDVNAWHRAIVELIDDPTVRSSMRVRARQLAVDRFSSTAIAAQLEGAYQRMIERKGRDASPECGSSCSTGARESA